jgi:hypothetical protein
VIPLAILLALMVSYGLAVSSRPVSGGFVKWLADKFVNIPLIGGFSVAQVLRLDRYLTQALGKHFQAVSRAGVLWVATLANYVYVVGYWTLYWPVELLHVVHWLVKQEIPRAINARTKPIAKSAANAQAQAKSAASTAHTTTKIVKGTSTTKTVTKIQRVAMPHAKEWEWIHNHWHALTHAVTGAIAIDLPVPFGRTIKDIKARLRRLEKAGAVGLGIGAVALALSRLKLGFLRCSNFGKFGRRTCGMDTNLLDSLLLDTLAIFSVISVVEFAKGLQEIEGEAVSILGRLVKEFPSQ